MNCFLNNNKKEFCSGCGACVNICPKGAIYMEKDNEGFYYPHIDKQKCVNCNLCRKVCPTINNIKNTKNIKAIYSIHILDNDILEKSASGGAFTGIVDAFCDKNYVIFGAQFDENFQVMHGYTDNKNKIDCFRKSKYVQSDLKNSYVLVKKFLNEGIKVLFSGTPCQVAGLKSFLGRNYDNLLCIDILCHGVPSDKVWQKYLNFIVQQKTKFEKGIEYIENIEFRKKTFYDGKYNSRNLMIKFKNGDCLIENSEKNLYLRGYANRLFLRPSCRVCKFASPDRCSDITIADCWGIEKKYPDLNPHIGESLLIINTKKGKTVFEKMKRNFSIVPIEEEFIFNNNECYYKPSTFHPKRNLFYDNLDKINFEKNIRICLRPIGFKNKVKAVIPKPIKQEIKRLVRKV